MKTTFHHPKPKYLFLSMLLIGSIGIWCGLSWYNHHLIKKHNAKLAAVSELHRKTLGQDTLHSQLQWHELTDAYIEDVNLKLSHGN